MHFFWDTLYVCMCKNIFAYQNIIYPCITTIPWIETVHTVTIIYSVKIFCGFWLRKGPKKCRCCLSVGQSCGSVCILELINPMMENSIMFLLFFLTLPLVILFLYLSSMIKGWEDELTHSIWSQMIYLTQYSRSHSQTFIAWKSFSNPNQLSLNSKPRLDPIDTLFNIFYQMYV